EPAATMRAGDGESCPAHPDWSPAAPRPTLPPTGRLLSSDLSGIRDRSAARPLLAPARRRKAVLWSALPPWMHALEAARSQKRGCAQGAAMPRIAAASVWSHPSPPLIRRGLASVISQYCSGRMLYQAAGVPPRRKGLFMDHEDTARPHHIDVVAMSNA